MPCSSYSRISRVNEYAHVCVALPLFSIDRVGRQRASQTVISIHLRRQYEHNVTLTRMDLSAVLWPEVPRGFAYILFDAFKEPVEKLSLIHISSPRDRG